MQDPERPAARSLYGMLILIFGLTAYAFLVAAIGDLMVDASMFIQVPYYLVTGVIWIFPVGKLLKWMADAYKK
jgi:poly(A) polymerase Pap1